ncbi:MAG: helix-turn-helix domain-containing protein [Rhodococcus sp. (in: high G+C Gram-positive bacteria)]
MTKASETTETTEPANRGLGQRLRQERSAAGLSLRELARRVKVSPSFISQVELGRAKPSIGTLYSIASELGLSLDDVMDRSTTARSADDDVITGLSQPDATSIADSSVHGRLDQMRALPGAGEPSGNSGVVFSASMGQLQRESDRPAISLGGVKWERLTVDDDPLLDFLRITYVGGSESCRPDDLQHHAGWEYGHILSGQLDVQVMFEKATLQAGDSINFASTTPHRLSNPYEEDCVAIWIVRGRHERT